VASFSYFISGSNYFFLTHFQGEVFKVVQALALTVIWNQLLAGKRRVEISLLDTVEVYVLLKSNNNKTKTKDKQKSIEVL